MNHSVYVVILTVLLGHSEGSRCHCPSKSTKHTFQIEVASPSQALPTALNLTAAPERKRLLVQEHPHTGQQSAEGSNSGLMEAGTEGPRVPPTGPNKMPDFFAPTSTILLFTPHVIPK